MCMERNYLKLRMMCGVGEIPQERVGYDATILIGDFTEVFLQGRATAKTGALRIEGGCKETH